ncbi:Signal peptidase I [Streptococcus sp. DD10]|uniref:signal peptidase I n=1 Tax=Streptococcus sp. DD10 TaxID=1777878 RepID=UPI0007964205|nr:signal peptidase I [Streptococcus sp. DD10]KXT75604.1 Signal peptidase I [Streptococcus sp. DD10]
MFKIKQSKEKKGKMMRRDKSPPTLMDDLKYLFGKLVVVVVVFASLYYFLFGVIRYNDDGMKPALKDGDLVVYYRLDKRYSVGDLLVYSYEGKERVARVIATEGSSIDINENGLIINGSPQQEQDIYKETLLYKGGITFPIKVPQGQLFVLGDNRTSAVDSRVFGPIPINDTDGKVVTLIRRRGF